MFWNAAVWKCMHLNLTLYALFSMWNKMCIKVLVKSCFNMSFTVIFLPELPQDTHFTIWHSPGQTPHVVADGELVGTIWVLDATHRSPPQITGNNNEAILIILTDYCSTTADWAITGRDIHTVDGCTCKTLNISQHLLVYFFSNFCDQCVNTHKPQILRAGVLKWMRQIEAVGQQNIVHVSFADDNRQQ